MAKQSSVRKKRDAETAPQPPPATPESPAQLDGLIHERMRLGVLSALAVNDTLSFNELKKILNTTDGNLSVHARKLEQAGYIVCNKSFEERKPRTEYYLAEKGRTALKKYLNHMEALIRAMRAF